jgi:hypothetical protein
MSGENTEALMFVVVICRACRSMKQLQLSVVTITINPIINPNLVPTRKHVTISLPKNSQHVLVLGIYLF